MKKSIALQIIDDLKNSELTFQDMSLKYDVSIQSINRINKGETYSVEPFYPLRKTYEGLTDNEIAFCNKLYKDYYYTIKQIHIILGKSSYNSIARATKNDKFSYKENLELEQRRRVFDVIAAPNEKMINRCDSKLIVTDLAYIKLLARMGAPLLDVLVIFMEFIIYETSFWEYPINSKERLEQYLSWVSNKSKVISLIGGVYNNKVHTLNGEKFFYDDVRPRDFLKIDNTLDLTIVEDIINFQTRESFIKRGA